MNFFDYTSLNDEVLHGLTLIERLLPLVVLILLVVGIYKYQDNIRDFKYENRLRYIFGGLMILGEIAFLLWNYIHSLNDDVRFITTLPLQLCSYAIWGLAFVMFTKKSISCLQTSLTNELNVSSYKFLVH